MVRRVEGSLGCALLLLGACCPALALRHVEQRQLPPGWGRVINFPDVVLMSLGHSGTTALTRALWNLGLGHCNAGLDGWLEPGEAHEERVKHIRALLSIGGQADMRAYKLEPWTMRAAEDWLRTLSRHQAGCIAMSGSKLTADYVWGWKEPQFVYLMPAMQRAYFNHTKFLLVARDPRDICTIPDGDAGQLKNYGDLFGDQTDCYGWWAKVWNMVLDEYEGSSQFAIVRIEDLVAPDPGSSNSSREVLKCVLRYVGLKEQPEGIASALASIAGNMSVQLGRFAGAQALEAQDGADKPHGFYQKPHWKPQAQGPPHKEKQRPTLTPDEEALRDFHDYSSSYADARGPGDGTSDIEKKVASRTDIHYAMQRLGYNPTKYALTAPSSWSVCRV
uniref:Protein-tyrosine sulfotransferase n=1 Tax=Alexandrium catenella TaxID=2925 RepID=A0A7S1WWR6_ALECA